MADDQHTGGMLALVPDNPDDLAVDGGRGPDDLHLTLLHLGDGVAGWDAGQRERLVDLIRASAPALDPVDARIMGHAAFNPDGGPDGDRTPVVVYLVGYAPELGQLREWARWVTTDGEDYPTPPEQHSPYLPHVTAADGTDTAQLSFTGPVRFGRMRLALADDVQDFPLGDTPSDTVPTSDNTESEDSVDGDVWPEIKGLTFTPPQRIREIAVGLRGGVAHDIVEGKALDGAEVAWVARHCGEVGAAWAEQVRTRVQVKRAPDPDREGMSLINTPEDLDRAISTFHRTAPGDRRMLKRHLKRRARQLGASTVVHERIDALAPGMGVEVKSADGWDDVVLETKVMSPDPRAAKLREYWAHGAGRKKWRPGSKGDFKRLRRHLAKYVQNPRVLNGLTANIHRLGTGFWPGPGKGPNRHKSLEWDDLDYQGGDPGPDEIGMHHGIEEWGLPFAEEDLSRYGPDDLDDSVEPDGPDDEIKAADPALARTSLLARIGQSMVPDDTDYDLGSEPDDDDSYEDTVAADSVWVMDASGVMHRIGGDGMDDSEPLAMYGPGAWRA